MNLMASLALFGWIPLMLGLFMVLPPRKAVFISIIGGWMFLPVVGFSVPGLPDYGKAAAACYAALLGVALFDTARLQAFSFSWLDAPMLVWCLCPFVSSLTNGLGVYDGLSAIVSHAIVWGLPYYLGRIYLTDLAALRELCFYVFIGGIIYVPLCLIELRLSPQLHYWVYGSYPNHFIHNIRWGGYRPVVFMHSGLMLGLWMAAASLSGLWLRTTGALRRLWGLDLWWYLIPLLIVTVLSKAVGALLLFAIALAALFGTRWMRTRLPLICLVLIAPVYSGLRISGAWNGEAAVALAAQVSEARAKSLATRIDNESKLIGKALRRPIFGWGRWGRSRVYNKYGKDITITDGLWVIALGQSGLVGLGALTLMFLVPAGVWVWRFGPKLALLADAAPIAVWVAVTAMYSVDNQLNAMEHPVFVLAIGGITTVAVRGIRPVRPKATRAARLPQVRQPT